MNANVFVIAHRLPLELRQEQDTGEWAAKLRESALSNTILRVKNWGMIWVGATQPLKPQQEKAPLIEVCQKSHCYPVFLDDALQNKFTSFALRILWPLMHYGGFPAGESIEDEWKSYVEANRVYAETVAGLVKEGDIVWVHDYQLLLVPRFLRELKPSIRIGFFLHCPFPSSELFRQLPFRKQLLAGCLAADLIALQTFDYSRHFKSACTRILSLEITHQGVQTSSTSFTQIAVIPIGIDPSHFSQALQSESVQTELKSINQQFAGKLVLVSVDRLDTVKGIPNKLQAMERLLLKHPQWRGKLVLVQIAVPSHKVLSVDSLRPCIHDLVARINGKFGSLDYSPVVYLEQFVSFPLICALFRRGDAALVTPLRDGMNLIAFEFIACQQERHGVLLLSEFSGAFQSLASASIKVNPFDIGQFSDAINEALSLPHKVRSNLYNNGIQHVNKFTAQRWAETFIQTLMNKPNNVHLTQRPPLPLPIESAVSSFKQSNRRLICIGLVGTIVPQREANVSFSSFGQAVALSPAVLASVKALASDPHTTVAVISSRSRELMDRLFGSTKCWLFAENGFFTRRGWQPWQTTVSHVNMNWKAEIKSVLRYFASRTPHSFVDVGESFVAWHFKDSDPETSQSQVCDLLEYLQSAPLSSHGFQVVRSGREVEIRPSAVTKGIAVARVLQETAQSLDYVLCVGRYLPADEDVFDITAGTPMTSPKGSEEKKFDFSAKPMPKNFSKPRLLSSSNGMMTRRLKSSFTAQTDAKLSYTVVPVSSNQPLLTSVAQHIKHKFTVAVGATDSTRAEFALADHVAVEQLLQRLSECCQPSECLERPASAPPEQ